MKTVAGILSAGFVLAMSLTGFADCGYCENDGELKELSGAVSALRADINLLNLINGMNFSTHQISHIIDCARQAGEIRAETKAQGELDVKTAEKLKKVLEEIVSLTSKNQEVPQELLGRSRELRLQLERKKHAARGNKKSPRMDEIADNIRQILFKSQIEILVDYNPCLIPPKNLKNPVLVGQASDSGHAIKILERARSIPDEIYDIRKEKMIDRLMNEAEKHTKFTDAERETARQKLSKIIGESRSMSDVDFELNKEELARKADFLNKMEVLKAQLKELEGDENIIKHKIIAHLLDPRIVPLLETRRKQIKEYQGEKPADFGSRSPAESCQRGGCAIKD